MTVSERQINAAHKAYIESPSVGVGREVVKAMLEAADFDGGEEQRLREGIKRLAAHYKAQSTRMPPTVRPVLERVVGDLKELGFIPRGRAARS